MKALTVRELIAILRDAPPDSRVLFMTEYADEGEADEVAQADIQTIDWTYESGNAVREAYSYHHPGPPEPPDERCSDVVQTIERVVVLSPGPTNLRFYRG
jgi:alkylated DNA repair dioxygenase AlkB